LFECSKHSIEELEICARRRGERSGLLKKFILEIAVGILDRINKMNRIGVQKSYRSSIERTAFGSPISSRQSLISYNPVNLVTPVQLPFIQRLSDELKICARRRGERSGLLKKFILEIAVGILDRINKMNRMGVQKSYRSSIERTAFVLNRAFPRRSPLAGLCSYTVYPSRSHGYVLPNHLQPI